MVIRKNGGLHAVRNEIKIQTVRIYLKELLILLNYRHNSGTEWCVWVCCRQ